MYHSPTEFIWVLEFVFDEVYHQIIRFLFFFFWNTLPIWMIWRCPSLSTKRKAIVYKVKYVITLNHDTVYNGLTTIAIVDRLFACIKNIQLYYMIYYSLEFVIELCSKKNSLIDFMKCHTNWHCMIQLMLVWEKLFN